MSISLDRIIIFIVVIVISLLIGYLIRKYIAEAKITSAEEAAKKKRSNFRSKRRSP